MSDDGRIQCSASPPPHTPQGHGLGGAPPPPNTPGPTCELVPHLACQCSRGPFCAIVNNLYMRCANAALTPMYPYMGKRQHPIPIICTPVHTSLCTWTSAHIVLALLPTPWGYWAMEPRVSVQASLLRQGVKEASVSSGSRTCEKKFSNGIALRKASTSETWSRHMGATCQRYS